MTTPTARLIAFIALLLLGGCYSAPVVQEDTKLKAEESGVGFVVAVSLRKWTDTDRLDTPLLQLLYRAAEGSRLQMSTITFQKDTDVVLQKLPAGEYVIYNSFFGFKHMLLPEMRFRVVPGQITYVGDFNATVKYPKIGLITSRSLNVVDNRNAAIEKLKRQYPQVAGAYQVRAEVTSFARED